MPFSSGLSIFISTLYIGTPTEPSFNVLMFSAASTGDVSVNPYPWTVRIPKSLNPFSTVLSSADAPAYNKP